MKRADVERFWSKVDRSGGPNACWPWKAGVDKDGYGKFAVGKFRQQKHLRAHRVALRIKTGRTGPVAMHWKCDNPPCCNYKHLKWASQRENRLDTGRKGREPRGEAKPITKLTAVAVLRMRKSFKARQPNTGARLIAAFAKKYQVRPVTIRAAISGRHNWKWLR